MENRIRKIREGQGLQQRKLAYVLDLSQSSISDIEKGKRRVRLDEAAKLAKYLNVRIDDLIENN